MRTKLHPWAAAVLVACASACQSSRYYDAHYLPAPLEVEVASQTVPGSQVRALVSVLGIARADEKAGVSRQAEIRLRLENLGTVEARVAEDGFALVTADLQAFGAARIAPGTVLAVPAGETRSLDVAFDAPGGDVDWSGLNLRFTLTFDGARVATGGTFARAAYPPIEPVHWHMGIGYGHRW